MCDLSGLQKRIQTFDVHDPQLQGQDLHPFFGELRSSCPVARTDIPGGDGPLYLVSRYEDCEFVFNHPEFFSSTATVWPVVAPAVEPGEVPDMLPNMMDPPDSTDYRRGLSRRTSRAAAAFSCQPRSDPVGGRGITTLKCDGGDHERDRCCSGSCCVSSDVRLCHRSRPRCRSCSVPLLGGLSGYVGVDECRRNLERIR